MIDKETAWEIALREINPVRSYQDSAREHVLMDEYTLEKEYGWVFFYQSRQYVETGDESYLLGGNGPLLVQKEDGQVFRFGSGDSVEWSLAGYEAGFRANAGKLTIVRVHDRARTLALLRRLRLNRVVPEFAHGVTWRIPHLLSPKQIGAVLDNLPAVFEEVMVFVNYETFQEMDASRCCDYTIEAVPRS